MNGNIALSANLERYLPFPLPLVRRLLVPFLDSGETEDFWALVMPKAESSLRDHLNEANGITMNEALSVLIDIAEALVAVEARGVVHRDIKPENVLLLDGRWHIADFGIAR